MHICHCSTYLKNNNNFLFKPLIKIIQTSLCSIFYFHSFILDLPCSLKTSEASLFFFHHLKLSHLSHQALISPISLISPHLSSSSHLPTKPKPKLSPSPSPSPAPAPAVAVPRRQLSTLTSLPHCCRPTRSSTSPAHTLDPFRRNKPLTHLEISALTLSSQTHDKELLLLAAGNHLKLSSPCKAVAVPAVTVASPRRPSPRLSLSSSQPMPVSVPAHASAHARRHRQPTSGQCSLFFSNEFFNCCFGLIFLGLVLFCGENWCCPYVVLGKIKKTFVLE